ncbi:MAG: DUF2897 family protein [Gammaproteobacteria bacterium]|nr:DUF2897 family protein [Gammaproteobacteria bacterium]
MSLGAWLIIILALGIIVSNIMLLKKTANMKMPTKTKSSDSKGNVQTDDQGDDWDQDNWGKDDWDKSQWEEKDERDKN